MSEDVNTLVTGLATAAKATWSAQGPAAPFSASRAPETVSKLALSVGALSSAIVPTVVTSDGSGWRDSGATMRTSIPTFAQPTIRELAMLFRPSPT